LRTPNTDIEFTGDEPESPPEIDALVP